MTQDQRDFEAELTAAWPSLIRSATVLCWSRDDVEDVVQETAMRAFKAYASYRRHAAFATWACAILTRVASAANTRRADSPDPAPEMADALPPVDAAVIEEERARRVIDAIRRLPRRQREMVTLHFLEQRHYREIAEALEVSVGTVKATLFAAKASLREVLPADLFRERDR